MLLIALAAVVVFLFAFHAKTAVYDSGTGVQVTASTSAKLWLNAQKMELTPRVQAGALLIWFAILFLCHLNLLGPHRRSTSQSLLRAPAPVCCSLLDLHRYLRPPPIR